MQDFRIHSLSPSIQDETFYLGAHLNPQVNSTAPFQYYHRFGGTTRDHRDIAVDVDSERNSWRMLSLDGPDEANKWIAKTSTELNMGSYPKLPQFSSVTETEIHSGTFSHSTVSYQHMHIPEIDFMIGGIHDFLERCEYEPFLRVYSTAGLAKKEMQQMANKSWSSRSEDRLVMRTASFGHGRQRLDMCVREGPIQPTKPGYEHREGMADELLVPMAIIATLRLRLWETGRRAFVC